MPHFEFTGASVVTGLKNGIGQADLAATLNSGSGWPTGADGKVFTATLGDKTAGQAQEKILCSGRTNDDLTIVERGYDDTAPQSWGPNTRIAHTISGVFAAEVSDHVHNDTRDDHSQYLNLSRHAGVQHTLAMMGAGSVGTTQLVNDSVVQDKIADDAVGTPQLIDLAVTTPILGDDSVTAPKIADAAIDAVEKFSAGVQPWIVAATDPGAVGADRLWFNTANRTLLCRNAGNTAWEVIMSAGPGINYTPTLYNITLGTGGVNRGRYRRMGRTIIVDGYVRLGSGGDVTGRLAVGLPFPAVDLDPPFSGPNEFFFHGAARGTQTSGVFAAVGVVFAAPDGTDRDRMDFIATAGQVGWDAVTPGDWVGSATFATAHRFSWFVQYEAADAVDPAYVT